MDTNEVNYELKIHRAWLSHCASFVKPCAKTLEEVVAYLFENYDTEPVSDDKKCF